MFAGAVTKFPRTALIAHSNHNLGDEHFLRRSIESVRKLLLTWTVIQFLDWINFFSVDKICICFCSKKSQKMNSYTRYNRCVFEWERALLKLVGHDFLGEVFEKNLMTFVVYALVSFAIATMLYTIIFFDALARIFCLLFLLIAIQVGNWTW